MSDVSMFIPDWGGKMIYIFQFDDHSIGFDIIFHFLN